MDSVMPSTSTKPDPAAVRIPPPILQVSNLTVGFDGPSGTKRVVHGIDFQVPHSGALAIVGESGSGKSVSVRGILGLLPSNARVAGQALLGTEGGGQSDLLMMSGARRRRLLGSNIGMVFQNAMEALNPSMPIERQLTEHLLWHGLCSRAEARIRAIEALDSVGIPEPERRLRMYPFQLSGGMRQRVMIAIATIARPKLLIADEPTTALDVTVQKQILDLLADFRDDGMGLVMITHDLGVARYLCDDAVVLKDGDRVDGAPMTTLIDRPQHPYTRTLVEASLEIGDHQRDSLPREESAGPLLEVKNLTKVFDGRVQVRAVDDVSFDLEPGSTLAVVGESGSGKSTLARMVLRLIEPTSGQVSIDGTDLLRLSKRELRAKRLSMQMVFQSPYGSLLPSVTAVENIEEPLRINRIGTKVERRRKAIELMSLVRLSPRYADVYPRQLSGGQQQRIAIARALALRPALLVADEPTSALDASVQIQVLELLKSLQKELGFALMMITHNLAVVDQIADAVLVMRRGRVVESGPVRDLFSCPGTDYTRLLFDAVLPVRAAREHGETLSKPGSLRQDREPGDQGGSAQDQ